MEVVTPPIIDFVMQYFVNSGANIKNGLSKDNLFTHCLNPIFWKYINDKMNRVEKIVKSYRFHVSSKSIFVKAKYASEILDLSNQFGEGWLIAGEVAGYARQGIKRIGCPP